MNGSGYWQDLKKKVNGINDRLSKMMTEDIFQQIKQNSRPREVPFDELTNEEMDAGVSNRYWRLNLILDGTYSGSKGFSSQDRFPSLLVMKLT